MSGQSENLTMQLAKHTYQMHSVLLALLVSNHPARAAECVETLAAILEHQEDDLTPEIRDAACDMQSQLVFLLNRTSHPAPPSGSTKKPAWLKGVIVGGVSE